MKVAGLITIYSGNASDVLFGLAISIAGIHLTQRIETFDGGETFEFESDGTDLQSCAAALRTAGKSGQFVFWAVEWKLIDDSGAVVERGLMTEDDLILE